MEFTFNLSKINQDVKKVLSRPRDFFTKDTERSWKESFSYFLILSAVGIILLLAYLMLIYPLIIQYLPDIAPEETFDTDLLSLLPYALLSYIFGIGFSFFWGFALMAWAKLFKLEVSFNKAYKIMTYARTPNFLLSWFPVINIFTFIYSIYLIYVGIKHSFKIDTKKSLLIIFSAFVGYMVFSSFMFFVAQTL